MLSMFVDVRKKKATQPAVERKPRKKVSKKV
jgi:hypothetical protein